MGSGLSTTVALKCHGISLHPNLLHNFREMRVSIHRCKTANISWVLSRKAQLRESGAVKPFQKKRNYAIS